MSSPARSLFVFGVYVVVAGAGLMLVPSLVLSMLGAAVPLETGWVRVVGTLAIFVGIYHIVAARNELLPYIKATVWARVGFAVLLSVVIITSRMSTSLLLFAAIDLAAAAWTGLSLRRVRSPAAVA
jgi:hypothetical protein